MKLSRGVCSRAFVALIGVSLAAAVVAQRPPISTDDDDLLLGIVRFIRNAPPTVTLTATCSPCVAPAQVSLSASASDPDGQIVRVEFYQAGVSTPIGVATAAPYSAVVSSLAAGSYTFTAVAIDNLNKATSSAPKTVNVAVPAPPTVTALSGPAAGNLIPPNTAIAIVASAVSPNSGIPVSIEFHLGDKASAEKTCGPSASLLSCTFNWTPVNEGVYRVRAVAIDSQGLTSEQSYVQAVGATPAAAQVALPGTVNVGAIGASFSVADSGAATYSVPIQVPPGAAGVQPSLAVSYSSQGGVGLLGNGWGLSGLSAITRCPKTYATDNAIVPVTLDADVAWDTFCLDGERLIQVSVDTLANKPEDQVACPGTYVVQHEYRLERDTYARIRAFEEFCWVPGPSHFEVVTKSGQVMKYGTRWWGLSNGYMQHYSSPERVNRVKIWPLDTVLDRVGNFYTIDYQGTNVIQACPSIAGTANDTNPANDATGSYPPTEMYPVQIFYTRDDGNLYSNKQAILFNYGARTSSDQLVYYDSASGQSQLSKRLTSIDTYAGGSINFPAVPQCGAPPLLETYNTTNATVIKTYLFGYADSNSTKKTLLTSITESSGTSSLPSTTFNYQSDTVAAFHTQTLGSGTGGDVNHTFQADLDGDGRTDQVSFVSGNPRRVSVCLSSNNWVCVQRDITSGDGASPYTSAELQLADINGDGAADLVLFTSTRSTWVCLSSGRSTAYTVSGCVTKTSAGLALQSNDQNAADPHFPIDLDGDGHNDLLYYDGDGNWHAYRYTGSGFGPRDNVIPHNATGFSGALVQHQVLPGDYNGDGRTDLLLRTSDEAVVPPPQWNICLSNFGDPRAKSNPGTTELGKLECSTSPVTGPQKRVSNTVVADFNGDGLADVASPVSPRQVGVAGTRKWRVCLSTGGGAFACSDVDSIDADVDDDGTPHYVLGDFNGDGRTDMAGGVGGAWTICYAKGNTASSSSYGTAANYAVAFSCQSMSTSPTAEPYNVMAGDYNGDGRTDLLPQTGNAFYSTAGTTTAPPQDVLTSVTNGLGATIGITYSPLTETSGAVYTKSVNVDSTSISVGTNEVLIQSPMWVVSAKAASDGIGGTYRTKYSYAGLKGRIDGRGLMGFAGRSTTEGVTSTLTCDTTTTCVRVEAIFRQDYPFQGRPAASRKYVADTTGSPTVKVNDVVNTWKSGTSRSFTCTSPPCGTISEVVLESQTERSFEIDTAHSELPSRNSQTLYPSQWDSYGNPTTVVIGTSDGFTKTTTNEYTAEDPTNWLLGRLTKATLTSQLPDGTSATRTTAYTYFGATSASPGQLKSEEIEPSSSSTSLWKKTVYGYDGWGNRSQVDVSFRDPSGVQTRSTSYEFDSDGRFPTTIINALNQSESREYSSGFGNPTKITAINGVVTTTDYDKFGRKIRETKTIRVGATTYNLDSANWTLASATGVPNAKYQVTTLGSDGSTGIEFYDNLQRKVSTSTRLFDAGGYRDVTSSTEYDSAGRQVASTVPVATSSGASSTIRTAVSYDKVNRVTQAKQYAAGSTTSVLRTMDTIYAVEALSDSFGGTAQNRFKKTVVRSNGTQPNDTGSQSDTTWANSQAQSIQIQDANGSLTKYAYDAFGNTICVTPPAGTPTSTRCNTANRADPQVAVEFDLRGRKTKIGDPDRGTWNYSYNGVDEVVAQTDARLALTTTTYDGLGRPSTRVEGVPSGSGLTAITSVWTYDNMTGCGNAVGSVCQVSGTNGSVKTMHYDKFGRLYQATEQVRKPAGDIEQFDSFSLYDTLSRPKILAYPLSDAKKNPLQVVQSFAGGAFVSSVVETDPVNGVVATHWSAPRRFDDGQLYQSTLGSQTVTRGYDAAGRVNSIAATGVESLAVAYDPLGNLKSRADSSASLPIENFSYDVLNRLTTVVNSSAGTKSYTYNALGDLTCRSELGSCTSSGKLLYSGNTHRLVSVGSRTYSGYDANGNVGSAGGNVLTYNQFDLPVSINGSAASLQYGYTTDHQRNWELTNSGTLTIYVGSMSFEEVSGTGATQWKHYISSPEGTIAVVTRSNGSSGARYWYRDHIGSIVAEADATGGAIQRLSFDAWGKRRQANGSDGSPTNLAQLSTQRGFTTHEMLDEVGLVHMNGRIYDPVVGRFLQADSVVQAPFNLQNYDRYAYVMNNPLSLTDPTGNVFGIDDIAIYAFIAITAARATNTISAQQARTLYGILAVYIIGPETLQSSLAAGFAAGGIQGGNIQSAVYGAFSAGAFYGAGIIAGELGQTGFISSSLWSNGGAGRVALRAAAGCAAAAVAGGTCRTSAAASGFAEAVSPIFSGSGQALAFVGTTISGGIGARIAGGKFSNGAVTSAFAYLFTNSAMAASREEQGRSLVGNELDAARSVFGDRIDYESVRVIAGKYVFFQGDNYVVTPDGKIYWPNACGDLATCGGSAMAGTFIHEMTHVLQEQSGINVLFSGSLLQAANRLSFGFYNPYSFSYDPNRAFSSYNIEQQGDIARGIYFGLYPNNIDYHGGH